MQKSLLAFALCSALTACGSNEPGDSDKQAQPELYAAVSFDECLQAPLSCFRAYKGELDQDKIGIRLIKMFPNSRVFEPVDLAKLRDSDRKTLSGAAFLTAFEAIARARDAALRAGFSVPELVNVDPLCSVPYAANNSFFRARYGYAKDSDTEIKNVICLGLLSFNDDLKPFGNDRFVATHEYFHALFQHAVVGADGVIPDEAIFLSHDLDAFNEGTADFFAEKVTQGTINSVLQDLLPWRTPAGRKVQDHRAGLAGHIYRDGTRWTELFSRMNGEGRGALPVLACTLRDVGTRLRRALAHVDALDATAGVKDELGRIVRNNFADWSYNVYDADLLTSVEACVPQEARSLFAQIRDEIFPVLAPTDKHATMAGIANVVFPSRHALCSFQKLYGLGPSDLRRYEHMDACSNAFSFEWPDHTWKMADREQAQDGFLRSEAEGIVILPGIRMLDGSGTDCKLRGLTAPDASQVRIFDARDSEFGPQSRKFSSAVFVQRRGSWYRDVPFGHFLPESSALAWDLDGPLAPLTRVGVRPPFRFTSVPTVQGRSVNGFNVQTWLTTWTFRAETREQKQAELAEWVNAAHGLFRVDPETGDKCIGGAASCPLAQNYTVECRSAMHGWSDENPLGKVDPEKRVFIRETETYIFDCPGEEQTCVLEKF